MRLGGEARGGGGVYLVKRLIVNEFRTMSMNESTERKAVLKTNNNNKNNMKNILDNNKSLTNSIVQ